VCRFSSVKKFLKFTFRGWSSAKERLFAWLSMKLASARHVGLFAAPNAQLHQVANLRSELKNPWYGWKHRQLAKRYDERAAPEQIESLKLSSK
jgi:hypothetical protein